MILIPKFSKFPKFPIFPTLPLPAFSFLKNKNYAKHH